MNQDYITIITTTTDYVGEIKISPTKIFDWFKVQFSPEENDFIRDGLIQGWIKYE